MLRNIAVRVTLCSHSLLLHLLKNWFNELVLTADWYKFRCPPDCYLGPSPTNQYHGSAFEGWNSDDSPGDSVRWILCNHGLKSSLKVFYFIGLAIDDELFFDIDIHHYILFRFRVTFRFRIRQFDHIRIGKRRSNKKEHKQNEEDIIERPGVNFCTWF